MKELSDKIIKTIKHYRNKQLVRARRIISFFYYRPLISPIFVIGCSRAGTTLVYKTFSESTELGSLHKETHDFWMALHPLKQRDWDTHSIPANLANTNIKRLVSNFFYANTGKRRIVDKNNQNGLSVPYLYSLFPDAHFIYIKRNPGDNIDSLIHGWNKPEEFATWSNEIDTKIEIENGKFRHWCFFLATGWRNYITSAIEEVCAFQYAAMNRSILDSKLAIPPKQWHEVSYESLINNPVQEFKKLFISCEILFDEKLQRHCKTVLKNPYNTFSDIGIEKWKTGENAIKIQKILPKIKDIVIDMGYNDYL